MRYDSDKDITQKLNKLLVNSERESKKAVSKAAKLYADILERNTPIAWNQTHSTHAVEVIKIANKRMDGLTPAKEIGFDKGNKRADAGWYIHFPDVGTTINGTVGQRPQHFLRKTHEMSKAPILAIYKDAVRKMVNVE